MLNTELKKWWVKLWQEIEALNVIWQLQIVFFTTSGLYIVIGLGYTAGNTVGNIYSEKTPHEYLIWYDVNWQPNGVMLYETATMSSP